MSFGKPKKVAIQPLPDPIATAPTPQEAQRVQQRAEAERRRRSSKRGRAGTILTGPSGELNTRLGQS